MTAGCDTRPVTAFGSIRPSDITHDRLIGKAAAYRESKLRRHHAEEVNEQIEDFEHKMGWRMRTNLGPRWCERREMEREEERTMGIKRPPEPRPKEELLHYDYSGKSRSDSRYLEDVGPQEPEGRLSAANYFADNTDNNLSMCRPVTHSAASSSNGPPRPATSKSFYVRQGRTASAGPLRNSSRLWTPYSMIEPIFLPLSSTKVSNDQKSNRISLSASSAKWEDRTGRVFWDVKEQQLNAALQRTEGNKLGYAHFSGQVLKKEHDNRVTLMRMKTRADFLAARERGEYYARCESYVCWIHSFALKACYF